MNVPWENHTVGHSNDYSGKILLSLIRRISTSPFACLLQKYGLQVDQNGLELSFCFKIVNKLFFTTRVQFNNWFLYSIILFFEFDFMALFLNWERFIMAERSVLLTCDFWLPRRIFFSGVCLSKTSTKLFWKV